MLMKNLDCGIKSCSRFFLFVLTFHDTTFELLLPAAQRIGLLELFVVVLVGKTFFWDFLFDSQGTFVLLTMVTVGICTKIEHFWSPRVFREMTRPPTRLAVGSLLSCLTAAFS